MIVENSSTYTASENTTQSLSEDELRSFSGSGFITMTSIAPADEVAGIRKILQDLVDRRAGEKEGSFFDTMEGSNSRGVLRSIQINNPSLHHRQLLETDYVRNATRIAQQLLSPQCFLLSDFLLLKPGTSAPALPGIRMKPIQIRNMIMHNLRSGCHCRTSATGWLHDLCGRFPSYGSFGTSESEYASPYACVVAPSFNDEQSAPVSAAGRRMRCSRTAHLALLDQ